MNHGTYFIFSIPVISIVVIAIYQVFDEIREKNFILERRTKMSADQPSAESLSRRYSDAVPPGTLRNPETSTSGPTTEVLAPRAHEV
ncbi:hypothetical protein [Tunturiibacter lichenicola]|jgi:hypothetical protein|uniref:hypothetical protein n=1 Tax=Tunturiibacter lichenicola TaxID=2051959 RepID=UPI003D9B5EDD